MTLSRGKRRALIGLCILAMLIGLMAFATPFVARDLIVHYLAQAGVTARIGNVDVDPFTGSLTIENARGQAADGGGFDIGRLVLSIRYPPLFSHQLHIRSLLLKNARVDVHRTGDGTLRVAGIRVPGARVQAMRGFDWDVGLDRLALDGLRIDYSQPAMNGRPAFQRTLTFNHASIHDLRSGASALAMPVDASIAIARGEIHLKGRITPTGHHLSGDFDLATKDFALDLVAPFTHRNGIRELSGRIDSKLHVQLVYDPAKAFRITLAGRARWNDSRLVRSNGPTAASKHANWQGQATLTLLRADHQPATLATNGTLRADNLDFSAPRAFRFTGGHVDWRGKTDTTLKVHAEQMTSEGVFSVAKATFAIPNSARFQSDHLKWQGHTTVGFARLISRRAKGTLQADNARLTLPGEPLLVTSETLDFNGAYQQQPQARGNALKLGVTASIDSRNLKVENTAIQAPWLVTPRAHINRLSINGLNTIQFDRLTTQGLRLFGDTNTPASVLAARTAEIRDFHLDQLHAYHLARLDITGATIHLRRDKAGAGVLSRFFNRSTPNKSGPATRRDAKPRPGQRPSFAIDQAHIAGPAAYFVDTTVAPAVHVNASKLSLTVKSLNTARSAQAARYKLSADVGRYGHFDSMGQIAPFAPHGANMDLRAYMRSLALFPLSGYLNAAMGRRIANGAADSTLNLKARQGQLHGRLALTLSNFRLVREKHKKTNTVFGLSMDTALRLIRSKDNTITFSTAILGDTTNPYFSMDNLTREAILAGLRNAVMSDYSPLGLLNNTKNALLNLVRDQSFHAITFRPGLHYVPPAGRDYLVHVGTTMLDKPGMKLTLTGYAVPGDAGASTGISRGDTSALDKLARQRALAVRDYLAARNIAADRLRIARPRIDHMPGAQPRVALSLAD